MRDQDIRLRSFQDKRGSNNQIMKKNERGTVVITDTVFTTAENENM